MYLKLRGAILFLGLMLSAFNLKAQIEFEPGYFIDNEKNKIECLIKNKDWMTNPLSFDYKIGNNTDIKTGTLKNIREFVIVSKRRFVRESIGIETSSETLDELSLNRAPEYETDVVFLEFLVDGDASLYSLINEKSQFYYRVNGDGIENLVFKKYNPSGNEIKINRVYQKQLSGAFQSAGFDQKRFRNLRYDRRGLIRIFKEYNEQVGTNSWIGDSKIKARVELSVEGGVVFSTSVYLPSIGRNVTFDNETGFRLGVGLEVFDVFNANKWSLVINPSVLIYKTNGEYSVNSSQFTIGVDYTALEAPVGVRYYSYISDKSKIFVTGMYTYGFSMGGEIRSRNIKYEIISTGNFGLGLGFVRDDKLSIGVRYSAKRDLLLRYDSLSFKYRYFLVNAGYQF